MPFLSHRRLSTLLVPITVSLYLLASACGGGNTATTTTTPIPRGGSASASATPGTGGGATNTPGPAGDRQVEVIDSGYSADGGRITGGVVLFNHDKNEAVAISYSVEVTIAGAEETVANSTVVLLPSQTVGDGFDAIYTPQDKTIDSFKINVDLTGAHWLASSQTKHLGITVASVEPDFVHGAVANPYDSDSGRLWLSVVVYNDAGKLVGGHGQGVPSIPAHASATFDAAVPIVQGGASATRIETYVSFQNDFPDWMK